MISIDGITWDLNCKVVRTVTIEESDISGMLMSKKYFSDVIGSFLSYEVQFPLRTGDETSYDSLYETLTNATGEHTIILPYGQGHVTFVGRIKQVKDTLYRGKNNANYWLGDTFQFISNEPYKAPGNNTGQGVS